MTRTTMLGRGTVALALTLATAASATAQPYGGGRGGREPSATLYELPNFQGRQVTIYGSRDNLSSVNFNDVAMSGRFQGRWRICEHSEFRGGCRDVEGEVPDLRAQDLGQRVSSLQAYFGGGRGGGNAAGWRPGGGWSPGGGERPAEGVRTVLFPYPTREGMDIAAGSTTAAAFCRAQGLGSAAWYDSSERAAQALDADGRYVNDTSVLRDVLCRKR